MAAGLRVRSIPSVFVIFPPFSGHNAQDRIVIVRGIFQLPDFKFSTCNTPASLAGESRPQPQLPRLRAERSRCCQRHWCFYCKPGTSSNLHVTNTWRVMSLQRDSEMLVPVLTTGRGLHAILFALNSFFFQGTRRAISAVPSPTISAWLPLLQVCNDA